MHFREPSNYSTWWIWRSRDCCAKWYNAGERRSWNLVWVFLETSSKGWKLESSLSDAGTLQNQHLPSAAARHLLLFKELQFTIIGVINPLDCVWSCEARWDADAMDFVYEYGSGRASESSRQFNCHAEALDARQLHPATGALIPHLSLSVLLGPARSTTHMSHAGINHQLFALSSSFLWAQTHQRSAPCHGFA